MLRATSCPPSATHGQVKAMGPARARLLVCSAKPHSSNGNGGSSKGNGGNGGYHNRLPSITASVDEINQALAECIKQAALASPLEKMNKNIGKEIAKAANARFRSW